MKFFPKITFRWQSLYNIYRRYVPLSRGQCKPNFYAAAIIMKLSAGVNRIEIIYDISRTFRCILSLEAAAYKLES